MSLDTTTPAGSIAVVRDDLVLTETTGEANRTHGQRLPGELRRTLEEARTRLDEIDLLAIAAGPGSFTGLRVGIATMQGLAFSRGLKIVAVSTLEALENAASRDPARTSLVGPWIDAQRGEVFAALYESGQTRRPPSAATPLETLAAWRPVIENSVVLFAGDGAERYRDVITGTYGTQARFLAGVPRLAAVIGRIAVQEPHRAVRPHAVVPLYVRRSDAELARERSAKQ